MLLILICKVHDAQKNGYWLPLIVITSLVKSFSRPDKTRKGEWIVSLLHSWHWALFKSYIRYLLYEYIIKNFGFECFCYTLSFDQAQQQLSLVYNREPRRIAAVTVKAGTTEVKILPIKNFQSTGSEFVKVYTENFLEWAEKLFVALRKEMALRGFSKFEQMFRAKLASDAPLHVLKAKKEKEGLTNEEV